MIPSDAHIRVASPELGRGQCILRRGYSFSRGTTAGPLDRGGHQLDGGLFFIAYARDLPGLTSILRRTSTHDALNNFTIHTASGVFAVPPGGRAGGFVGEQLFS
jgi:deferrochelatase/peroxidase EfeB